MNEFSQRSARKAATRAELLAAARRLFVSLGYERTTIRDVARAAGVATGTVFVHFPDKSALLAAALDEDLHRTLTEAFATLPDASARARSLHIAGALYRMYALNPPLSRVLVRQSVFLEGPGAVLARERLTTFCGAIGALLAPDLRPGLDPGDAAAAFFAAYFAGLVDGLSGPVFDVDAVLARLGRQLDPWLSDGRKT